MKVVGKLNTLLSVFFALLVGDLHSEHDVSLCVEHLVFLIHNFNLDISLSKELMINQLFDYVPINDKGRQPNVSLCLHVNETCACLIQNL